MAGKPGAKARRGRTTLSVVAAAAFGVLLGVGVYTAAYAKVPAYLGSDPATCANCHAMQDHYDSWSKSSHAKVATCNDCHLPHDGVISKYLVKAEDGVLHAAKFTTGNYPENIVIRDKNLDIANASCLYCHDDLTDQMRATMGATDEQVSCVRCHSGVGHE